MPDPFVPETVLTHSRTVWTSGRSGVAAPSSFFRFDSQDPNLAARAVNAVVENYVRKKFRGAVGRAQKAPGGFPFQLQDLKAKLEKSQDDLQKYASDNGLLYLVTDKGRIRRVSVNQSVREIQDELTKAEADRFEKESIFRLVQSGDYSSLPGVLTTNCCRTSPSGLRTFTGSTLNLPPHSRKTIRRSRKPRVRSRKFKVPWRGSAGARRRKSAMILRHARGRKVGAAGFRGKTGGGKPDRRKIPCSTES